MPSNYERRIEALEAALMPEHEERVCVLWGVGDDGVDAAVARWRVDHDWPDDGRHPIQLLRISWASASENR